MMILCVLVLSTQLLVAVRSESASTHVLAALEKCDLASRTTCIVSSTSANRAAINAIIDRDPALVEYFQRQKRLIVEGSLARRKRETDCSSICCSNTKESEPYSHWKDVSGWQEVVNTPEYPQRVTFEMAICSSPNSPCRGVQPTDDDIRALCSQSYREHNLLVYNSTTRSILSRKISIPSGCVCKLSRSPLDSVSVEDIRLSTSAPLFRRNTNTRG
uniref:Spaetzle domain-containing protein n=1 Tax=Plectus sambesii TaxID=2011161 RepID=A0A914X2R4_9BILA